MDTAKPEWHVGCHSRELVTMETHRPPRGVVGRFGATVTEAVIACERLWFKSRLIWVAVKRQQSYEDGPFPVGWRADF